jgi:hypothetical protein
VTRTRTWIQTIVELSLLAALGRAQAKTEYVLVNNNNSAANSAILYGLDTSTGYLDKVSMLDTGGQGEGLAVNFSGVQQAASESGGCIFVLDTGSSDIAAFSKATEYKRVGNYFDPNLISDGEGDSLALSPNGKFLYASYTNTGNLGAWSVSSHCKLTLVGVTNVNAGSIKVTANGRYLIGDAVEFSINRASGALTYVGGTSFTTGACARQHFCTPYGVDVTKDGKFAVFASWAPNIRRENQIPVVLTARITSKGLTNPRVWGLNNYGSLRFNNFPFFGAAGYAGNGDLYFGVHSGGGNSPGVLTTSFIESPVKFAVRHATVVDPEVANIAVTGNLMIIAQYPNQIGVFRIKKNGSLKLLSTTTIDDQGEGLFSLSIFPNTR